MSMLKPTGFGMKLGRDFDLKHNKAFILQSEYVGVTVAISNPTAVC